MRNETYKIFGVGYPRSGTTTLKTALKEMGFKTGGPNFLHDTDTTVHVGDWMCLPNDKYKDLDEEFPNAQFILTVRKDAQTWYDSVVRRTDQVADMKGVERQRKSMYGSSTPLSSLYMAKYYRRIKDINSFFQEKYGSEVWKKLLVVCWEKGDGWDELGSFLHRPYPNKPFPHKNPSPNK